MRTVELEDHHPEYIMRIMDARWRQLDKEKTELLHTERRYHDVVAEMSRCEVINERMRNAE